MKRIGFVLAMVGVCAVTLLGSAQAADKEPYRIGALFAVTGPASFLGEPERNTAEMVKDMINASGGINGHPIELFVYDTEANATKTVVAAKKLINRDRVLAIIGPSTSGTSMAVVPIVNKAEVPMISCGASLKIGAPVEKRKWVFKVVPGDDLAVRLMYDYMKKQGIKKAAIMSVSTGYGISGRGQLNKLAPEYGIEIVADETYGPKESDLTAQLTKIRGTGADAIINWSIGPPQVVVTRNWKQLGIPIPLYQSYGFGSKRNIKLAGGAAEGVICPVSRIVIANRLPDEDPHSPVVKRYKALYEEKFKGEVSVFGGHAWDAMFQLAAALKAVGPDRARIRDYLETLQGFVGNNSIFNRSPTDHVGLGKDAYVMVVVKDGDWAILE
ncbi:MAG: ABC transporter substrate-binding protein [Desulfobacteraceae bacterium]|uniref:ABC transporter substrate-binding protein n=1 Tax=Candidatus Desulfacyla euxinica TaxID=2841693 RepID=A0A8J6N2W3_9DELT|nr:ABC transporter substrate-binding protein [Candidatus Desulfacyla euxinica]MBL6977757.1 ABC transporter substrate-binding protein [Desulfobacteraceae bacterium]